MSRQRKRKLPKRTYAQYLHHGSWHDVNALQMRYLSSRCTTDSPEDLTDAERSAIREDLLILAGHGR